jgi:hypothetical protein
MGAAPIEIGSFATAEVIGPDGEAVEPAGVEGQVLDPTAGLGGGAEWLDGAAVAPDGLASRDAVTIGTSNDLAAIELFTEQERLPGTFPDPQEPISDF